MTGIQPRVIQQTSGIEPRLQAVSVVDELIVWVSGLDGTYAVTRDGGTTWTAAVVPGADSLQFRDLHAVDAHTAYLLSAGRGARSRIYKTYDAGTTWHLQFQNDEPEAFFDCMAFWDSSNGVAFSDAVDGEFIIIRTSDGEQWRRVPSDRVPSALPGEIGFAASGTCLVTHGDSTAWFGTGGGPTARVFTTTDRGAHWTASETPIVSGTATSGIMSLTFFDETRGAAVGGELEAASEYTDNVAVTNDGGRTWNLRGRPPFPGPVYGITHVAAMPQPTLVAVGPNGLGVSTDQGWTWIAVDSGDFWSVAFASPRAGWAVGPGGTIAKVTLTPAGH